ncbi:MAG: tRNA (adenosine(37)-N6)-threonylcarbamoyltransferase complex ATPase subunit type 1 TsaE [Burkholderiaceae bacterium]
MTSSPTPSAARITLALADQQASDGLGRALAAIVVDGLAAEGAMPNGFTIHFSGDLGAGKTTVVRALLQALGVTGRIKSPTYTLVEPYVVEIPKNIESRLHVKLHCYHFDFYRFEDPQEWLDAGFRDYFSDAALRLVEWPERARSDDGGFLPPADLHVTLDADEPGRRATLSADTVLGAAWLSQASLAAPWRPADAGS